MDNHYYDPYRYGYPPPPDPDPCCHLPPPPPYPPPPLRPSNSFPAYLYPPGAPPAPYLTHSGPLQYPPAPQPQYPFPYPYTSPPLYSHPDPAASVPAAPPPPASVAQPYESSHDPPPPLQQQHSFGHDFAAFDPGELRLPPPHSDSFIAAYGRQDNLASAAPDLYSSGSSAKPVTTTLLSTNSTSSSSSAAYPPIDTLLADMRLSDQGNLATESPSLSTPSSRFDHRPGTSVYPSGSFSGPFSPHAPHSAPAVVPATPFSWSQHGTQSISMNASQHGPGTQIVPFQPSKASLKVMLLHGNLDIWIFEARNLPNMDMFSKTIMDMVGSTISGKLDNHMTSDPYVTFSVTSAVLGRTYVISNSENPDWNQHFYVPVAHYGAEVQFVVKDSDVVGSQLIGTVSIPAEQIYNGSRVEGTYPILDCNRKQCKPGATLRISIQYIPMEMLNMYHYGVGSGPDYSGVLGTYFPLRKGGMVKLYQDAHVSDNCLPDLNMDRGLHYEHGKCWRDICDAIKQARRLIYITGWSVYHKVSLVRDDVNGSGTLGELLRSKSREGVRVLLLVWDDPTSRTILGFQKEGIMQTHDEETRRFFKHSSVHVLLCPRSAGKRHSWVKQQEVGIIYTHHQKTVIVDSDAGYNKRKIIAFVGGLDLCDGRYDTPSHHLFRTLHTLHKDDYHNPTFVGTNVGGPREPWHDLHTRIDGPAAYDVLKNFEERWARASKPRGIKKLKNPYDDALLIIERIPDIIGRDESTYINDSDPEGWHVQIFRSIDSNSVKGFPKDPKEASSKNLVCGKNVLIDMSIHTAYVKAIRAAQHFIYIENQYFLGSSYNWESHKDLGANNLIPMEIALKIANKIKANERFSAYIVIPMWPEGVPTGVATQRILFWQNKTMQMMYKTVYKALVEVGLENIYTPQDYLNFFCLGNREALDGHYSFVASTTTANTCPSVLSQKNRRFMIYVHSKGMIVDDEYVIVGSANINQRSLEGTRDTEIAMGAYQPEHTWGRKLAGPRGQIHAYRMSLWAEHIGFLEEGFTHPESLECMRRVRALGEQNWMQYTSDEVTEMKGHLLKYPVDVDRKGKVRPLPGCETFPDVGGCICGSFVAVQENLTI